MPKTPGDSELARAIFQAGLLDERRLRQALASKGEVALGPWLISQGWLRAQDLHQLALDWSARTRSSSPPQATSGSSGSGAWTASPPPSPTASGSGAWTVSPPPSPTASGSGAWTVSPPPSQRGSDAPPAAFAPPHPSSPTRVESSRPVAPPSEGGSGAIGRALKEAPGTTLPPGTSLGPYTLERLIARGGMGAVFVATHSALGRRVALKVLLAGDQASGEQVERFRVEARASAQLNHPGVVPIYEVGSAAGFAYLTMELVEGPSLRALIRQDGPLEPRRALALLAQVARGVGAAHAASIIHRDLKPENVLVAEGDVAKVMDFGLAKDLSSEAAGLTVSGALLGTPAYMAPEQAGGEEVGPLADVYGLGAILYECLTGRPPFEGQTLANIITKVLTREPVAPRSLRPALNRDVETICLKALAREPARRYASAEELAEDAERWLAGEAIVARPPSRAERLARWTRRHLGAVVGASVGLGLAAATVGWFVVVQPRLAARAAHAQALLAAESDRVQSRAFQGALQEVRAALRDASVGANADERDAALRAISPLETTWQERWEGLPQGGRAGGAERPPFFDLPAERARVWWRYAEALRGERALAALDEEARREIGRAFTEAFRQAPTCEAGARALAGLTRLVLTDPQATTDEIEATPAALDFLLAIEGGLPEGLEAEIRSRRAGWHVRSLEMAAAARVLGGSQEEQPAGALTALAKSFAKRVELAQPRPIADLRVRAGSPPALELTFRDGSGGLYAVDVAGGELTPLATVAAPGGLPRSPSRNSAFWAGPSGRALGARFLTQTGGSGARLVLFDAAGRILKTLPRVSQSFTHLEFWELDGDPSTAELVCVLGPNRGDSLWVQVDAQGTVRSGPLDPKGRLSPDMPGSSCYVHAVAAGPLGPSGAPRLVLAYGAWGSNRLRVFRWERGQPVFEAEALVGMVYALTLQDLDGDGVSEVVAARAPMEERWDDRWGRPGLAAYAYRDGAFAPAFPGGADATLLATLETKPLGWGSGAKWLRVFRAASRCYAAMEYQPGSAAGGGRKRGQFLLALLSGPEPGAGLVDVQPLPGSWSVVVLDADDDGDDELLVLDGHKGTLSLLGAGVPAHAPEPRPLSERRARLLSVGLLADLGFSGQALKTQLEEEQQVGVTPQSETYALALLEETEGQPCELTLDEAGRPTSDFLSVAERFLAVPGRSPGAQLQARALRVRHLVRSTAPAMMLKVDDELRELSELRRRGAVLEGAARAQLRRAQRVISLRRAPATACIDFTRPSQLGSLVCSDPVRLRLEPERGLVGRLNRRVPCFAGVPVRIRPGALRLEVEFRTRGLTWNGRYELGLFRGFVDPSDLEEPFEGLTVGGDLWRATADLMGTRLRLAPGCGRPSVWPWSAVRSQPVGVLHAQSPAAGNGSIGYPHILGGHMRATLEFDPESSWGRFALEDLDREGELLQAFEGTSSFSLAPGTYWVGLVSTGRNRDYAGANFPPWAEVVLERVRLSTAASNAPAVLTALPSGTPPGLAAGGQALRAGALVDGGAASSVSGLDAYSAAVGELAPGGPREAALLQRADARARAGDEAGARRDLEQAVSSDALGLLRAVEDDGDCLGRGAARTLAEALRARLAALSLTLEGAPRDADRLEARAVVHRLRGDLRLAVADLEAARGARKTDRWSELAAWLLAGLGDAGAMTALERYPPRWATPERYAFSRSFWLPEDPRVDAVATARSRVQALLAARRIDAPAALVWLDRLLEVTPDDPEARLQRASLIGRLPSQNLFTWWRRQRDMEAAARLLPNRADLRWQVGAGYLGLNDFPAAARAFERALALGLDPAGLDRELTRRRSGLEEAERKGQTPRVLRAFQEHLSRFRSPLSGMRIPPTESRGR